MACAGLAQADDTVARPSWSLRGFGSFGAAYSNHDGADYTSSVLKASGAGYSSHWSTDVDSRLGAQLGVKLDARWSAVLQVISEQRLDNTYRPIVEWANVKFQATPDLALRFGRIALPMFLAADYRKVGYAYPWARTPVEVYGAIPFTNSDGIDATYRWNRGGLKNTIQAFVGHTDLKLTPGWHIKARRLAGISDTIAYGAFSARASVLSTELTLDSERQLFDGLREFGPQGGTLVQRYAVDHKQVSAYSIGASFDPGNWFAMGELGRMKSRSFLGDTIGVYTSAGYRFGDFTPYLAYARVRSNGATTEAGLNLAGVAPFTAQSGATLNGDLNALLAAIPVQRTASAGVRWDCTTDVALKLQADRVTPLAGSRGTFINVQPGFRSGRSINVASVVLDFVF
jgi:hypothetical protein